MPDQWTEVAYVAISDDSGNEYQFGAITDTIDIAMGARDIEAIATLSAARVIKFIPEEVTEITMEVFPVGISADTTNGFYSWFLGLSHDSTSGVVTFARKKFRVTVLWTTASSITSAAGAIGTGDSLRMSFWSCYLTTATADFSDDILKSKVTFKCPPYDRSANGLIKVEEVDAGTLTALNTFQSGNMHP